MGRQINYWMGYEDFLIVAQAALDNGCIIAKESKNKEILYSDTLDIVTQDEKQYYFVLENMGELSYEELIYGYSVSSGNVAIEASYSYKHDMNKQLMRSRLYVMSGYYDTNEMYVKTPEEIIKVFNRIVRVVKKVAPYTELVDTYTSMKNENKLQPQEYKHKEYVSPSFLHLKLCEGYKLL